MIDENTPYEKRIELATNRLLEDVRTANSRMAAAYGGAGAPLDSKRPKAWAEYGWKATLSFADFYGMYSRSGIGHGVIEKIIQTCWRTHPWIIQGDKADKAAPVTKWENNLKSTIKVKRLWRAFEEADRRRLVGRFSGMLLHVNDSQPDWSKPVDTKGKGLIKVTPVWAENIKPISFDDDKTSEFYGEPLTWQYSVMSSAGVTGETMTVHRDRIFILGDWRQSAVGYLEPAFNALTSIEKVEGGSGESFLKNAARQLAINFDKEVNLEVMASAYGVKISDIQKIFDDVTRSLNAGVDASIITQGATTTSLVTTVSDPTPTYTVNLNTVSAALDIPAKIIIGMQTGERASSEDQRYFEKRCQSRRENELNYDVEAFVEHTIRIGVANSISEFTVMWDDLAESTPAEKLATSKLMSEINNLSPGEPIFEGEEIREAAGYDSNMPEPPPEGDAVPNPEGPEADPEVDA